MRGALSLFHSRYVALRSPKAVLGFSKRRNRWGGAGNSGLRLRGRGRIGSVKLLSALRKFVDKDRIAFSTQSVFSCARARAKILHTNRR